MKESRILYASAATTADHNIDFNTASTGGVVVIDVTATAATPSVVFTIQGVDPASDAVWTILASAAVTATGTTTLKVHPAMTASANAVAKDMLPQAVRLNCNHADGDSITYSISFLGID